eukprot:1069713-Pleurochrysis_carterae.AAC.3
MSDCVTPLIARSHPWEQRALPSATGLSHAVDGLDNAADAGPTVRSYGLISGRRATVHHFAGLELTLKVGSHEVPTAHGESALGSEGRERAQRCGSHRSAEGLLVFYAGDLCAALDAEPSLESAIALSLVDPYQAHESSSRGNVLAVNELPAAVVHVVGNFGALGGRPTRAVVAQCLFARFRVGARRGRQEGTTGISCRKDGMRGGANGQESCGLSVAEWVSSQAALEVFSQRGIVRVSWFIGTR